MSMLGFLMGLKVRDENASAAMDGFTKKLKGVTKAGKDLNKVAANSKLSTMFDGINTLQLNNIAGALDKITGGNQNLVNSLESTMIGMKKTLAPMGVAMGKTGQDLKKWSNTQAQIAYSLNESVDVVGKASIAMENASKTTTKALDQMGLSTKNMVKLEAATGLSSNILVESLDSLANAYGFTADEQQSFMDEFSKLAQVGKLGQSAFAKLQPMLKNMEQTFGQSEWFRNLTKAEQKKAVSEAKNGVLEVAGVLRTEFGKSSEDAMASAMSFWEGMSKQSLSFEQTMSGAGLGGLTQEFKEIARVANFDMAEAMMGQDPKSALKMMMAAREQLKDRPGDLMRFQNVMTQMLPEFSQFSEMIGKEPGLLDKFTKALDKASGATKKMGDEAHKTGLSLADQMSRLQDNFESNLLRLGGGHSQYSKSMRNAYKMMNAEMKELAGDKTWGPLAKRFMLASRQGNIAFFTPMRMKGKELKNHIQELAETQGFFARKWKAFQQQGIPGLFMDISGGVDELSQAYDENNKDADKAVGRLLMLKQLMATFVPVFTALAGAMFVWKNGFGDVVKFFGRGTSAILSGLGSVATAAGKQMWNPMIDGLQGVANAASKAKQALAPMAGVAAEAAGAAPSPKRGMGARVGDFINKKRGGTTVTTPGAEIMEWRDMPGVGRTKQGTGKFRPSTTKTTGAFSIKDWATGGGKDFYAKPKKFAKDKWTGAKTDFKDFGRAGKKRFGRSRVGRGLGMAKNFGASIGEGAMGKGRAVKGFMGKGGRKAMGLAGKAAGATRGMLGPVVKMAQVGAKPLMMMGSALSSVVGPLGAAASAFMGFAGAALSFLAIPALIAGAVIGLVVVLTSLPDKAKSAIADFFDTMRDWVMGMVQWVADFDAVGLANKIVDWVKGIPAKIVGFFTGEGESELDSGMKEAALSFGQSVINFFAVAWMRAQEFFGTLFGSMDLSGLGTWLAGMGQKIGEFIMGLPAMLLGFTLSVTEFLAAFLPDLDSMGQSIAAWFTGLGPMIDQFFADLFAPSDGEGMFANFDWGTMLEALMGHIFNVGMAIAYVTKFFVQIIGSIAGLLPKLFTGLVGVLTQGLTWVKDILLGGLQFILSSLGIDFDLVGSFNMIWDPFMTFLNQAADTIGKLFDLIFVAPIRFVMSVWDGDLSLGDAFDLHIWYPFKELLLSLKETFLTYIDMIFVGPLNGLINTFASIGTMLKNGFAKYIWNPLMSLVEPFIGRFKWITEWLKMDENAKHDPTVVMKGFSGGTVELDQVSKDRRDALRAKEAAKAAERKAQEEGGTAKISPDTEKQLNFLVTQMMAAKGWRPNQRREVMSQDEATAFLAGKDEAAVEALYQEALKAQKKRKADAESAEKKPKKKKSKPRPKAGGGNAEVVKAQNATTAAVEIAARDQSFKMDDMIAELRESNKKWSSNLQLRRIVLPG